MHSNMAVENWAHRKPIQIHASYLGFHLAVRRNNGQILSYNIIISLNIYYFINNNLSIFIFISQLLFASTLHLPFYHIKISFLKIYKNQWHVIWKKTASFIPPSLPCIINRIHPKTTKHIDNTKLKCLFCY